MASLTSRPSGRRLSGQRGAEIVELAVAMPVLLLMLAGIFDVGFLMNHYSVVTNAAREGARVAAVPGWVEDDVRARVNDYLTAGGLSAGDAVTVVEPVAVTAGSRTVNAVRVVVSYQYDYLLFDSIAGWFTGGTAGSPTVTARSTMRREVAAGL